MSRMDYRKGNAPIRTALELSVILPVPLMMIVDGFAAPSFPMSSPSSQSPIVRVVHSRERKTFPAVTGLPLDLHWSQWESVCVPLLEDARLATWRGHVDLLCAITLTSSIVGPGGVVIPGGASGDEIGFSLFCTESVGKLFGCDPSDLARVTGKTSQYLDVITKMVFSTATAAGF